MKKTTKHLLTICIILFVLFNVITFFGALAKLQHWPMASLLLNIGIIGNAICFIIGGITIIKYIYEK